MGYPVWNKGADSVESGLGCTLLETLRQVFVCLCSWENGSIDCDESYFSVLYMREKVVGYLSVA